jgi:hypothetical protein
MLIFLAMRACYGIIAYARAPGEHASTAVTTTTSGTQKAH